MYFPDFSCMPGTDFYLKHVFAFYVILIFQRNDSGRVLCRAFMRIILNISDSDVMTSWISSEMQYRLYTKWFSRDTAGVYVRELTKASYKSAFLVDTSWFYVREWAKASSKSAFSGDTQGSYKIEIKASSQKEKKPLQDAGTSCRTPAVCFALRLMRINDR